MVLAAKPSKPCLHRPAPPPARMLWNTWRRKQGGGGGGRTRPPPQSKTFSGTPSEILGTLGGVHPPTKNCLLSQFIVKFSFYKCCFGIFAKCSSRNPRRTLNLGEGAQDSSLSPPSRESSWRRHLRNKYLTIIDGGFIYTSVSRARGI